MIATTDWYNVCASQINNPYRPGGMYICVYYGLYNIHRLMTHDR